MNVATRRDYKVLRRNKHILKIKLGIPAGYRGYLHTEPRNDRYTYRMSKLERLICPVFAATQPTGIEK